jgi:hypothetical protein
MTKQLIITKQEIADWVVTGCVHVLNEFPDDKELVVRWDTDLDGNDVIVVRPKTSDDIHYAPQPETPS